MSQNRIMVYDPFSYTWAIGAERKVRRHGPVRNAAHRHSCGSIEQGPTAQELTFRGSRWIQIGSIAWLKTVI